MQQLGCIEQNNFGDSQFSLSNLKFGLFTNFFLKLSQIKVVAHKKINLLPKIDAALVRKFLGAGSSFWSFRACDGNRLSEFIRRFWVAGERNSVLTGNPHFHMKVRNDCQIVLI